MWTGESQGTILNFHNVRVSPTVTTNAATSITTTSAVLNGDVNPNGYATDAWFEYGTDPTLASSARLPPHLPRFRHDHPFVQRIDFRADSLEDVLLPGCCQQQRRDAEGRHLEFPDGRILCRRRGQHHVRRMRRDDHERPKRIRADPEQSPDGCEGVSHIPS